MKINILSLSTLVLLQSVNSSASVSVEQANKLGVELTPVGAEMKGNKAGSIPAYTGGLAKNLSVDPLKNVYAGEQPLFVITASNLEKYKRNLSEGQIALFSKYPNTYKMPVYQTHRSASFSKEIHAKAKKNAIQTKLLDGGNGLANFDETIPFAVPKTGVEVIWNHVSRYRGGSFERSKAEMPVHANGDYITVRASERFITPQYLKEGFDEKDDDNILFYYTRSIKSPARLTGNVFLVHETIDQVKQPRMAWMYNAGHRRVRRAPQVAYDAPAQGSEGLRTVDQVDMYNGAPDKYNWKLIGKQEVYIPYNSYKLTDPKTKYSDIVEAGHINQDYTRYELHRVWKVEASLKEGERHIYGKRTFYIDEDSWQISLADQYDNRGQIWRVSEGHPLQFVNADTFLYISNTVYDLFSGRYVVDLMNEENNSLSFGNEMSRKTFTTGALRRTGR